MKTKIMETIIEAGKEHLLVHMLYRKENGKIVSRIIAPYEITDDGRFLYATCSRDEHARIRSYLVNNIAKVTTSNDSFEPRFEVKL